jgi:hypothetical protein
MMGGLGVRQYTDIRYGIPGGYEFIDRWNNMGPAGKHIEYNLKDGVYFPGSIRLIYLFGKRLRP